MSEWQPIETAPMDGKFMLGYYRQEIKRGSNLPRIQSGILFFVYNTSGFGFLTIDHQWVIFDGHTGLDIGIHDLTHWMPLPEPPEES